jgi:2-iminobutanoate/2-iminopropanoate deaminase
MNRIYAEFFANDPPARTTVAVADLPGGVLLEVDVIAVGGRASLSPASD